MLDCVVIKKYQPYFSEYIFKEGAQGIAKINRSRATMEVFMQR
jgi:hypothetical protein